MKLGESEAEEKFKNCIEAVKNSLLKGEELTIPGFGKFYTVKRKTRTARNPRDGSLVQVPERIVPNFKSGNAFKIQIQNSLKDAICSENE